MKGKKTRKILSTILSIALIIVIALAFYKYTRMRDTGKYDFCVEWNYNIYRESLLWKCFDFKNGNPICGWEFDGNRLVVFNYYNHSEYEVYDCTKLAKSIDIILDVPKMEESELPPPKS